MGLADPRSQDGSSSFLLFHHRQFRSYWLSALFTDIAQWTQLSILAWLVFHLTNSPALVAVYAVSRFLPKLLLTPLAGVTADRINRLHLLRLAAGGNALISLAIALLITSGGNVHGLLTLNLLVGAAMAFDQPARRSLLPAIVTRNELMPAVSLNSSVFNISMIAGPVLAAVLLEGTGTLAALYINAGMYALGLLPLLFMRPQLQSREAGSKMTTRGHFIEGLAYLRRTPLVAGLLLVSMFPGFLDRLFILFLPLLTDHTTPAAEASGNLMPIIRGAGAIIGGLALAIWGGGSRKWGALVLPVALACALTSALFIFAPWLALSLAVLSLAGLLRAVLASVTTTLLHHHIPDGFRGRVMAI